MRKYENGQHALSVLFSYSTYSTYSNFLLYEFSTLEDLLLELVAVL